MAAGLLGIKSSAKIMFSFFLALGIVIVTLRLNSQWVAPLKRPEIKAGHQSGRGMYVKENTLQNGRELFYNHNPLLWNNYEITLNSQGEQSLIKKHWVTLKNNVSCYIEGTNLNKTYIQNQTCLCKELFRGPGCAIPAPVWDVKGVDLKQFHIRLKPKKIIMGIVVTQELELTEVRFRSLLELVDVFILCEGNTSAAGLPKPLHFFEAFKSGYLSDLYQKIIYVFHHDGFPDGYVNHGWRADGYVRNVMSQRGLKRIKGLSNDDVFMNFDADEIPSWEVVSFLKWFDMPYMAVKMIMRHSIFGFFYQSSNTVTDVFAASTIGFLNKFCQNNAICLRRPTSSARDFGSIDFLRMTKFITIGTKTHFAGNECSWCFSPELIYRKHYYAQLRDGPLPGGRKNPANFKLDNIKRCIKEGKYFTPVLSLSRLYNMSYRYFAPRYMIERPKQYQQFLFHPDDIIA